MCALQWWHIAIVIIVGVLLFGGKRLPGAARGLGQSMRILKTEVKAMNEENKSGLVPPAESEPAVAQALPASGGTNVGVITIEGRPVGPVR
jgi:sec-independent protein translocase protein TatA